MLEVIVTPSDLGQIVRRTRKALRLTQPQLALASGVGVRFIVDLEAGKPTVRLEHVLRVLQSLGLTSAICDLPDVYQVLGSGP